jgi:hypothetical protein
MPDDSEVSKVLSKAGELRKAVGRFWTALILLFALWTLRKRPRLWATVGSIGALLVAGWLRLVA